MELMIFAGEGFEIPAYKDAFGNTWFHAGSVCRVFGLPASAIQDCVKPHHRKLAAAYGEPVCHVSEAGFLQLAFAERNKRARLLQQWVLDCVLPVICGKAAIES